mmetsp:Transcript_17335/g.22109  ORF Transcript_17335/g.22109 Transcript_17335/m.22109 type:complete len:298 (-) Transcript_17335:903-1796(-)
MQRGRFNSFEDLSFEEPVLIPSHPGYKSLKRRRLETPPPSITIFDPNDDDVPYHDSAVGILDNRYQAANRNETPSSPGSSLMIQNSNSLKIQNATSPVSAILQRLENPERYQAADPSWSKSTGNPEKLLASEFFGATKNKYKSRITKFVRAAQVSIASESGKARGESNKLRGASVSSEKDLKTHFSFKQDAVNAIGDVIDVFTDALISTSIQRAMNRQRDIYSSDERENTLLGAEDIQNSLKSLGVESQVIEALKERTKTHTAMLNKNKQKLSTEKENDKKSDDEVNISSNADSEID